MLLRFRIVAALFVVLFTALIARLFYWQVIKAKELSDQAKRQHQSSVAIGAARGNILADDGSFLVKGVAGWLVYASVPEIKENVERIADKLAPLLSDKEEEVLNEANRLKTLLSRKGVVWVPLKHKINGNLKANIEALDLSGIGFQAESLRSYPEASAAAHLLGFVGKDTAGLDKGYFGLEGYYDLVLSGRPGVLIQDTDAKGVPIALGDIKEVGAVGGVNLLTHINKRLQLAVEEKLEEGLARYGAKSGSVIIMKPRDGAVLAMSSLPAYDPADYSQSTNELFKNPVISDSFEPGSIFKIVIMASALDKGVVEPETKCDLCSGPLKVDKYTIETWNKEYFPDSTMTEIIVHSDNVGMVFVGQKLGSENLFDYLTKFGLGRPTGIDLQGESSPKLRDRNNWNIVDLSTASFGQGVAVTPLQMLKVVAIIANGGIEIDPRVVKSLVGDNWQENLKPGVGERVVSKEAAEQVTQMMVEAAKSGEAKWTHLQGFRVAGKTGTAQIPISGHYDEEKTIASFVGFAPFDEPKFVMLVTLREPQSSPWASETAAPLWYNIAKDLFLYFGIQPES